MTKKVTESGAVRAWARAAGYDIGVRGLLPASLKQAWLDAGAPWPDGKVPAGWVPTPPETRGPRHDHHRKRTSSVPIRDDGPTHPLFAQPAAYVPEEEPDETYEVELATTGTAQVMTLKEVEWWSHTKALYGEQHKFEAISDLQDLDRLLLAELLAYRWGLWLSSGRDYKGDRVDHIELGKQLKERGTAIAAMKDAMGISKKARDASASSVAEKWDDLLRRAKAFGGHRVEQLRTAMVLVNELSAIVGTFERSDEEERRKLGYQTERDIIDWIRDDMLPRWVEVDEHFRNNEQAYWGRS